MKAPRQNTGNHPEPQQDYEGWLIERYQIDTPVYFTGDPKIAWTQHPKSAIRFSDQGSAEKIIRFLCEGVGRAVTFASVS